MAIILIVRNISYSVVEETKTHILRSVLFFNENRTVYEIM